jgi:hypothetical protein
MWNGKIKTNYSDWFFADTRGEQFQGANLATKILSHIADLVCSDLRVPTVGGMSLSAREKEHQARYLFPREHLLQELNL